MPTDYNAIAELYRSSKQHPWRRYVEAYTLLELVGDPAGKAVLDMACGDGFYTRLLKHHGAAKVVGIDLSERMIALAREDEARRPLGVGYLVGDAKDLDGAGPYDLVTAAYLLNYAHSAEELTEICRAIVRALKPGCRFVSVNNNPAPSCAEDDAGRKYGFHKRVAADPRDGSPVTWTIFMEDGSFEILNYHLSIETHERAFRKAGFRQFRWHAPRLAPAGETEYGTEFWSDFLRRPPVIFLDCSV